MAVLGEGRVVQHRAIQAEPAEPAIGEVQVDLFAQPPLGADAAAIADQQHANDQLGIHRRTTDHAVEGPELAPDVARLDEAVDRAQQVVGRHMLLKAEAVEQSLLPDLPLAHHGRALLHRRTESALHRRLNGFFQQNQPISATSGRGCNVRFREGTRRRSTTDMGAILSVRPGRRARPERMMGPGRAQESDLRSLGKRQGIFGINAEISHRAFKLGMAKEDLHGSQVARPLVDERHLGPAQAVGAVG